MESRHFATEKGNEGGAPKHACLEDVDAMAAFYAPFAPVAHDAQRLAAASENRLIDDHDATLSCYTRRGYGARAFGTTRKGGPRWCQVTRRVTRDLTDGTLFADIYVADETSRFLHRCLPKGPRGIEAKL